MLRQLYQTILLLIFLCGFSGTLLAQKSNKPSQNVGGQTEQLARVGILRFTDLTGTKNFGYMPNSLADAIDTSLQRKFEYNRVDPKKLEEIAAKQRASPNSFTFAEVKATAKASQSDLLIFGYFTFDKQKNEIFIQTDIYVEAANKVINLPAVRNTVDDSIFTAVDRVAQNIVEAMVVLAAESAKPVEGENPKEEKAKITKESIKEESKPVREWGKKKWLIGVNLSAAMPMGEFGELLGNSYSYANPYLWFSYRAYGNFTAGLELRAVLYEHENKYRNNETISLDITMLGVSAGHNFYFHPHWMASADFVGGYYLATMRGNEYSNPYFGIQAAGRYLITSWLGAELKADYYYLYDSPVSMQQIGMSLGLILTF